MPEGDSLHRIAVQLQPLVGHGVEASSPNPRGLVTGVAAAVDGRRLAGVEAVGKHLLLRFEGGVTVRNHLRMTGRWRVDRADVPLRGRPWLLLRAGGLAATQWNGPVLTLSREALRQVGPDILALRIDLQAVAVGLRASEPGRLVGEALQDQRLVAGIGNMWMSECLWATRLSPWLTVGEVDDSGLCDALEWVRRAMQDSVEGTRPARAVYRRVGRPCMRCGTAILGRGQGEANRVAYWCPTCQPGSVSAGSTGDPPPRT